MMSATGTGQAMTRRRRHAIRVAVLLACVVAALSCVTRFDQVMGLFDWRADQNEGKRYLERLYGDEGVVRSRRVVEEARARMPDDARYRVVVGPRLGPGNRFTPIVIAGFLEYFLLPRRLASDGSADWAFCYGCDPTELGQSYEPIVSAGAVSFGPLRE